jgi:hypothetical protein
MSDAGRQVDAFTFRDSDTGEECWVGVRVVGGQLLLTLSRQSNGDVEVPLGRAEAERLARALTTGSASGAGE